jgi:hypothetical protein
MSMRQPRKRTTATSSLRQRIIDKMQKILELIATEDRHRHLCSDVDFRRTIVWHIKTIAELETMPPSRARRAFDRVAKDVKRLKASLASLPPSAHHLVDVEVKGLDVALSQVKNETGRTATVRKRLAAEAAFDLIADHGSYPMTLTPDGPYITLANVLFFVATGKRSDLETHCRHHFDYLKTEEGVSFYSRDMGWRRKGPRGKGDGGDGGVPAWLRETIAKSSAEQEASRQRREAAMKKWPPLDEVVDAVLGSRRSRRGS